jgi:CheY-like chemotaxis protein
VDKAGPIIIIEDDKDDQEMLMEAFKELGFKNEVKYFSDGEKALEFLTSTPIEPFLIFSDINMPKLSGLELREKIRNNENLRLKCVPYLFFSTFPGQEHLVEAYSKSIQGFFVKPMDFHELVKTIKIILEYWQHCVAPDHAPLHASRHEQASAG